MIQIISNISGQKHVKFMNWLCAICDTISFILPNFGKTIITNKNKTEFPEFDLGFLEYDDEDKKEFEEYKRKVEIIIAPLKKSIIKQVTDVDYCGFIDDYEKEIFVIKLDTTTKEFLIKTNSLNLWRFPEMPEDICFFKNGKCFMRTVTHENLIFIYDDTKDIQRELKKMKIKFLVVEKEPVPGLP